MFNVSKYAVAFKPTVEVPAALRPLGRGDHFEVTVEALTLVDAVREAKKRLPRVLGRSEARLYAAYSAVEVAQ